MTCDILLKISGQDAVYISVDVDHTSDEDENDLFPDPFEPALFNGDTLMTHIDLTVNETTGLPKQITN